MLLRIYLLFFVSNFCPEDGNSMFSHETLASTYKFVCGVTSRKTYIDIFVVVTTSNLAVHP